MKRRAFVRTGLAAAVLAPGLAHLPTLTRRERPAPAPPARPHHPADPVRLHYNENPLGLPDSARAAIAAGLADASLYPGENYDRVVAALAQRHGVPPESVVLGNGSTELIQMAVQMLAADGGRLVVPDPTFADAVHYAGPHAISIARVPLRADHAHDLERMAAEARSGTGPVLVYICNPNNPTGTLTPSAELDRWIDAAPDHVHFLVDEAYFDYVDDPRYHSTVRWIRDRPNVIVLRTFSKIYAMAGMRLGYALANPATVRRLSSFAAFTNTNQLALHAGLACLDDHAFVTESLRVNAEGRRILTRCLDELGLDHLPSHANFVMHRVPGGLDDHIRRMRERGFRVGRPFPPMLTHNRVSIGLPEQMERFAEVLRSFRREGLV